MANLPKKYAPLIQRTLLNNLGDEITFQPKWGDPVVMTAIIAAPREEENLDPACFAVVKAPLSGFPAPPAPGDTVAIGEALYGVFRTHRSATDMVTLTLQRK